MKLIKSIALYLLLLMFAAGLVFSSGLLPKNWLEQLPPWAILGIIGPCILIVVLDNILSVLKLAPKKDFLVDQRDRAGSKTTSKASLEADAPQKLEKPESATPQSPEK